MALPAADLSGRGVAYLECEMNAPTVTLRGVTYEMQPISDERWAQMRESFEANEAAYAERGTGRPVILCSRDWRDGITYGT